MDYRLVTRLFALLPCDCVAILFGTQEKTLDQLLVYSQYSYQLRYHFQSSR